jgi:hypothetical protein
MNTLQIAETDETPQVNFDKEKGIFEIKGRSLPEDSVDFYVPILSWVKEYVRNPNPTTDVIFRLDYINTASSKLIQDIISTFEGIPGTTIVWYFLEEDETMEEMGHEFSEMINLPFELKKYH